MPEITQNGRLLKVRTPLPFDVLLIDSLSGFEAISQPFRFDAQLLADVLTEKDRQVDPDQLVGHDISIEIETAQRKRRFINGVIRSFTMGDRRDRFATYQAEIHPWFSLLALASNCRIFQEQSIPDVITSVVSDHGYSKLFRNDLTRDYTAWDYCVQYRETDFAFLSRLMEAEGISYYFEHKDDGSHIMVLVDSPDRFKPCPAQSNFRFNPAAGIGEFEDTIDAWKSRRELITGKWNLRDYHFEMPSNNLEASDRSVYTNQVNGSLERYDHPGEYSKKYNLPEKRLGTIASEGEKYSRMRMEQEENHYKTVQGLSRCRTFSSGCKFTVTSEGGGQAEGSWLLTSVNHNALQYPDYVTQGRGGEKYRNSYTAIPASAQYYPLRVTPRPIVFGHQTAVVVDENPQPSEEIWPDKYGRVRVRFLWDRDGKSACWVRVGQPWAGKAWGQLWIPRVGDEVIVSFLEGDPDCPLIVGSVYNHDNLPPFALPDNKTQSGILTRSSPDGGSDDYNMVRIEDKKGSEEIFVHAQKLLTTEVEQDESRTVGGGRTTSVTLDDKRTVEKGNDELIVKKGDRNVTISAGNRSVTISQGNDKLAVAMGNITVQASSGTHKTEALQVEVDGTASIKLSCGGSSIEMTPATITITSPLVKINC